MKVKNIKGTSGKKCKCKSWYEHWKRCSGYDKKTCSNVNCTNKNLIGAHVRKYNSTDKKHYIVPLCQTCNKSTNIIDVGSIKLVSANKLNTCESDLCN